jgi:hypothetical protein
MNSSDAGTASHAGIEIGAGDLVRDLPASILAEADEIIE